MKKRSVPSLIDTNSFLIIFEQTPISTQIFAPDGTSLAANKAWEQLWGVQHEKILGYNVLKDKQLVEKGIMQYIQKGFKGDAVNIPAIQYVPQETIPGKGAVPYRYVKGLIYPIKDSNGTILNVVLHHEDITEQKQAEDMLEETNRQLRNLIDTSPLGIWGLNKDWKVTDWNSAAENIFGWKSEEVIGKSLPTVPSDKKEEFVQFVKKLWEGKRVNSFESTRKRKDGSLLTVQVWPTFLVNTAGEVKRVIGFVADITKRKELEKQKDEFLGIVSHELKTPVTSIKAYGQVLQRIFQKKGEVTAVEQLLKMDTQIDKLTNLIGDLLDVTKIHAGRLQFVEEYFDFNELVNEIVEEVQRTTQYHTIKTQLTISKTVFGDRERIGQVITNLLTNAIKYSPDTKKILVHSDHDKKSIKLCVQDFGIGIPKEKQEKVFEQFFRVSGPKEGTFPGLGLGLYVSSEIIKRQNGRLWVESVEGKGSTFCFSLPLDTALQEKKATPHPKKR